MSKVSRSSADVSSAIDIWTKLEREPRDTSPQHAAESKSGEDGDGTALSSSTNNIGYNSSIVFIGDAQCGKSTLIQTFLKPSAAKDTKPTIALEYSYARKTTNNVKSVANLWEVGGDLIEPKLMEIPITVKTLSTAAVVVCCDLSKPHNALNSVLRSISATKEIVQRRAAELQASNVIELNAIRESVAEGLKNHPDAARLRYLDVPMVIIANKFDTFKSLPIADRRAVINCLRFVAHYFGATLLTMSGQDATQRENYRTLISAFGFNLPVKLSSDINLDKLVYVTRGQDNFKSILLGLPISSKGPEQDSAAASGASKNGIISSESEMSNFLTHKGVTRECWGRLADYIAQIFGDPDPLPSIDDEEGKDAIESGDSTAADSSSAAMGGRGKNPFPEPEIDDMRVVRDAALERYVKEMDRQEELRQKMNARSSASGSGSNA